MVLTLGQALALWPTAGHAQTTAQAQVEWPGLNIKVTQAFQDWLPALRDDRMSVLASSHPRARLLRSVVASVEDAPVGRKVEIIHDFVRTLVFERADDRVEVSVFSRSAALATLTRGGDSDDVARLKAFALRWAGVPADRLYLLVGMLGRAPDAQRHAVLAVDLGGQHFAYLDDVASDTTRLPAEFRPLMAIALVEGSGFQAMLSGPPGAAAQPR